MNIYIWVGLELVSHMTDKYMLSPSTRGSPSSPANMSTNKSSILQILYIQIGRNVVRVRTWKQCNTAMDHHSKLALLPKYVETLLEDQVNSAKQVQVTKNLDWPTEGDKLWKFLFLLQFSWFFTNFLQTGCFCKVGGTCCFIKYSPMLWCFLCVINNCFFPQDQDNFCSLYTMLTLYPSTKSIPVLTLSSSQLSSWPPPTSARRSTRPA